MNTNLQLATNYTDACDYDYRREERLKLIARAVEAAKMNTVKTRTKKVWRTMPDSHYRLKQSEGGETPHHCQSRAEINGM